MAGLSVVVAALGRRAAVLAFAAHMTVGAALAAEPRRVGDARLEPVAFAELSGWPEDDHAAAFAAFRRTCEALASGRPSLRPAAAPAPDLAAICREASQSRRGRRSRGASSSAPSSPFASCLPAATDSSPATSSRRWRARWSGRSGFPTPLLARPDDLVTIPQGQDLPGVEPGLGAARRTPAGFEPYPDRAAIEDGALGERARPVVHLRDPVDAFVIHVQGSARIRLPDGRAVRVAYAGRNGRPYTSIGRSSSSPAPSRLPR